eukprot:s225_g30.t1
MTVLQLHEEVEQWQKENDCLRLPTKDENFLPWKGIEEYCEKDKKRRVDRMKKAYPPDMPYAKKLQLDCLDESFDLVSGVKWRSDLEREEMEKLPGWDAGNPAQPWFVPLLHMLPADGDVDAVFAVLEDIQLSFPLTLQKAASMLQCTPTVTGVGEALARPVINSSAGR